MSATTTQTHSTFGNRRVAIVLVLIVAGMVGLSFAAVPLYRIFCQVTGYGGTTRVAESNLKGVISREMTTRFDATITPGLPITVRPATSVSDPIGNAHTVTFLATNNSDHELHTTASFNVTPELMGSYFNKIECFCFTEQTLPPGETVEMPVTFFLDPDLDHQAELDTVQEVTLSYTFYPSESGRS